MSVSLRDAVSCHEEDLAVSRSDAVLMFFLLRLFRRLQRVGTVAMIDLAEYGSDLES
jgi:hypothetical protein